MEWLSIKRLKYPILPKSGISEEYAGGYPNKNQIFKNCTAQSNFLSVMCGLSAILSIFRLT